MADVNEELIQAVEAWKVNPATTYTPRNILQDYAGDIIRLARACCN